MNVIHDLNEIQAPLHNPVLTIGNFDGVHLGHLALFDLVKARAKALQGQSSVMTFEPHPLKVMRPGNGPALITPISQKLTLIDAAGIDVIFCVPFTRQFAAVSAEEFVRDILVGRIGIKEIVVGYDYTFGHKRLGDIGLLQRMGEELGFKVHVKAPIKIDETLVSSTSIRQLVQAGDLAEAERLLGRHYQISGTVIRGRRRGGRLLGYPTANLNLIDELIPGRGVYVVTVLINGTLYPGVTNIGYNPTFGENALSVETHLLDFSEDILGRSIRVNFLQRLRDEKTFDSVAQLSEQIARDIEEARKIIEIRGKG